MPALMCSGTTLTTVPTPNYSTQSAVHNLIVGGLGIFLINIIASLLATAIAVWIDAARRRSPQPKQGETREAGGVLASDKPACIVMDSCGGIFEFFFSSTNRVQSKMCSVH